MLDIGQQRYYDKLHKVDGQAVSTVELFQSLISSGHTNEEALAGILEALTEGTQTDVTLQDAADAVGVGSVFNVGGYRTLTIAVSGTAVLRTIQFKGTLHGVTDDITGLRMNDLEPVAFTEENDTLFTFDVSGLDTFAAHITAISGGTVSVRGRAVK